MRVLSINDSCDTSTIKMFKNIKLRFERIL